jgi:hypothetical protein
VIKIMNDWKSLSKTNSDVNLSHPREFMFAINYPLF